MLKKKNTKHTQSPIANPWLILAIGIIAGTFAAPFIKLAQQGGLPSPIVASGRMLLAAIIITPLVWRYYRHEMFQLNRRDILFAMLAGLCLQAHFQLFIVALETTSVLVVVVLVNTGPLWVAMIERFFLKERVNKYVWIGLIVTIFGGMYIAFNASNTAGISAVNPLFGASLSAIAAVAGAATLALGRNIRQKVSLFPYIWIVFGSGGLMGVIYAILTGTAIFGHSAEGYFWLLMLTLIPQLIGHSCFNFALGYITATMTSLSGQMITVTATIAAFLIFREVPTMTDIIGSAIIAAGVLMAIIYRQKHISASEIQS